MAHDNFIGPYGMIQVIRDGIARRGAAAVGDSAMLQMLNEFVRVSPGNGGGVFAMAVDDGPVQPNAPQPPAGDGPKAPPVITTPSTPPTQVWTITEEWQKYINRLPDLPPPTAVTGGGQACRVKKFDYPVPDSFVGVPAGGDRKPGQTPGFKFEAHLVWDDIAPYRCECCVFRQWLEKSSGGTVYKKMHRDNTVEGGREYGGEREDGSNSDSPNNDKKKGLGTWDSSRCELYFEDNPGEGPPIAANTWKIKYSFIGIVFDRCNNWKPVAVKGMIMERHTSYYYKEGDDELSVKDEEGGTPKLTPMDGPPK